MHFKEKEMAVKMWLWNLNYFFLLARHRTTMNKKQDACSGIYLGLKVIYPKNLMRHNYIEFFVPRTWHLHSHHYECIIC